MRTAGEEGLEANLTPHDILDDTPRTARPRRSTHTHKRTPTPGEHVDLQHLGH